MLVLLVGLECHRAVHRGEAAHGNQLKKVKWPFVETGKSPEATNGFVCALFSSCNAQQRTQA